MRDKLKPDWAGEDFLSHFVNLLIGIDPLYKVMKHQARQVIIKTAHQKGVPWRETYQELERSGAKALLEQITNNSVLYPDYYKVPFHAYDQGNLSWQAAFEAIPATWAMALRVWPQEKLSWATAQERLRGSFHQILGTYSPQSVTDVLDIGCSVGISTLALHRYYCQRQHNFVRTVGLDLSPYMLAVAKIWDEKGEISEWRHAKGEETGLPDNSFDVVTLQFLLHELPRHATRAIFQEVLRILRPGGCLAIVDNNPLSQVIQNLPPALFVLMKSTEPWSDDYYTFDVEAALKEVGFEYRTTIPSDPRHRTIIATKN
ncbi:MAG TPA: class I SAM-dependent methyltransferase [Cyanobacteria bacterium UBA8803]|nr:class I SAM-dependent methyltransferase [Cyanobacteria bacterium UBA9273]HBL59028.1 class I SAM-dependent methyltransferase [Cyanobacteria bacterium UBA8803]